ncbi:daunorubicin resistance ABC transporter ATPase subunit [Gloeomargarita lithophora Alchichica-D10]|uniref:Daunorubicin resistance ABC transporter ATPase subunit n=1 Tax=Gloeomargarita lithophora Alchichica-D10 TaxID=1188229 RepID=A0A1J0AF14_9CYAN|nr:ABC transporter ATP-binding protein [Gloeomargarita lithophora]APB34534.1 daunorubicin resistance ABC transporter ATPase subunit [Gloeomargarita lithophora Alchichica-D10]
MALIEISNLHKTYGEVTALNGVSLAVPAGEIFGLLGPNGAGKTTLIRCLCTLTRPDQGEILVAGISTLEQPRQVRQKLGYVAQELALDKVLTGRELLQLHGDIYHLPRNFAKQRIGEMVTLLNLEDWVDRRTGGYSGGMKKRLDLAMGLLHQPQVLVLDEPTVGLDIESRTVVWEFLRNVRSQGTTVFLTSHYLEEIDALADQVAILDQGQLIASDTPAALKSALGGERVTVKVREFTPRDEAERVRDALQTLHFVQNVIINTTQGNSLNLVIQPIPNGLTVIQEQVTGLNLPVFSVMQSQPSLDDVYLAATGRTLQDADLAARGG